MKKILLVLVGLLLVACTSTVTKEKLQGKFILDTFNGKKVTVGKPIELKFEDDKLNGSVCNRFFGSYEINNNMIKSQTSSTFMLCQNELDDIETALFLTLREGGEISLNRYILIIKSEKGTFRFVNVKGLMPIA